MKKDLISVDGFGDLMRDPKTNAVLNINRSEILDARERKRIRVERDLEDKNLKETVNNLQQEMSDIKSLLTQLVERT